MLLHNMKNNLTKSIFPQKPLVTDLNHRSNDISRQQRHFSWLICYLTELDYDELAMDNRRVEDFSDGIFFFSLSERRYLPRGFQDREIC